MTAQRANASKRHAGKTGGIALTEQHPDEPDILTPVKHEPLQIRTLDGDIVASLDPPDGGWSHDSLHDIVRTYDVRTCNGADAYLGTSWIGSTEV